MPTANSQQSNPFSTGGGGVHFEEHVQSAFVVLMLSRGVIPCIHPWPLKKIKLQGKYLGYNTDDFIAFAEEPGGKGKAKLLAQIKHSIKITKKSSTFGDVIKAAWTDYKNENLFNPLFDKIALISGPLSAYDVSNTRIILEWARTSENADEFLKKVYLANFSSKTKQEKCEAFKFQLKKANEDIDLTDQQFWTFLKSFHLLGYDLDIKAGVTHSLLNSIIKQYSSKEADYIWFQILNEVLSANQNAGTISFESLPDHLKKPFEKLHVYKIPTEFVKNPQKEKTDWFESKYQDELAVACLVGGWDEKFDADQQVIEQITDLKYENWIKNLRKVVISETSPLTFKNGKWKFIDRIGGFEKLSTLYFDNHLQKLKEVSEEILTELDPKFELKPDERFAAQANGKVLKHSYSIRNGIAKSLAIIGSSHSIFTNTSANNAELIVQSIIREVLKNSNWQLWASLDHLLPLLAETSPDEFLIILEKLIWTSSSVFSNLFEQEGDGITDGIYNSGMLWALETLAWDEIYLTRVTIILGFLASIDPGGKYANRPVNSLTTIFLPWLPQTCAPVSKRKVAVSTLINEYPDHGWQLLVNLIPQNQQSSSGSHKPKYRKFINDTWSKEISNKEYYDQISMYSELLVSLASKDSKKMKQLIEYLHRIPVNQLNKILKILNQKKYENLKRKEKLGLWSELNKFVIGQVKYEHTEWTLNNKEIEKIKKTAEKLAPKSILEKYVPLFSNNDYELIEEKGDWDEQYEHLEKRRQKSIKEIFEKSQLKGLIKFVKSIDAPQKAGFSFGSIAPNEYVVQILPKLLVSSDRVMNSFAKGFVQGRLRAKSWDWVSHIIINKWQDFEVNSLLLCLPFVKKAWDLADKHLKKESLYWENVDVNPYYEVKDPKTAIVKLINNKRAVAALNCLHTIFRKTKELDSKLAIKALLLPKPIDKVGQGQLDVYNIVEIIKALQSSKTVNKEILIKIELSYLSLLNKYHKASPITLENKLIEEPEFFCELIRYIYRSTKKKKDPTKKPTQREKNLASTAYTILDNWTTPPGIYSNIDNKKKPDLNKWIQTVRGISEKSGHIEVALLKIGEILFHSPPDPNGLWIHKKAAKELNAANAEGIRRGFRTALFNSRGVHRVDPSGKKEFEMAGQYYKKADDVENEGFHRLATTLRDLGDGYTRSAKRVKSEDRFDD